MRLIDADKLQIKHFVQRGDQPIGYEGTQPLYGYTDLIAYDVDKAPTVKAIPVERLKSKIDVILDKCPNGNEETEILCKLLYEWEKENEGK